MHDKFEMQPICTSMLVKFYSCKKRVLQTSEWSLWSKVMGTSYLFRYSGVVSETAMTSQAVSFCFCLDSKESRPP
jgi:hypothetical protein